MVVAQQQPADSLDQRHKLSKTYEQQINNLLYSTKYLRKSQLLQHLTSSQLWNND